MLHAFITSNRDEIIGRCRRKVASRFSPPPTDAEINHGVPMFLDQLVDELRQGLSDSPAVSRTAAEHGFDLRQRGFTVGQVVHNYGDVCQAITEMATQQDANISANDFRMLNHCLDNAIASAVTEFNRDDEPSLNEAADHHEQVMMLARLLRNSIRTGVLAMEAVKSGLVGMAGSTGGLLVLSTVDSERLINRLIAALNVDRSTQSQTVQQ